MRAPTSSRGSRRRRSAAPVGASDLDDADEVLRRRAATKGGLRGRHPPGAAGDPGQPALPLPPRADAGRRLTAGADLPHRRRRPGLAPVVLPLGHGAGRGAAARPRRSGTLRTPRRAREAGAPHARRSARRKRWRRASPSQWLRLQDLDKVHPGSRCSIPYFDDTLGRRDASARPSCSSTASSARTAACSTCSPPTTRSSTSGSRSTTASRTSPATTFRRVTLPTEPPRPARPGQHPDADLGRRSHLAGAARQVGDGSAARLAAAAAAARTCRRSTRRQGARTAASCCRRASAWSSTATNPACTSCHRVIDPLGLALENFDVTGAWRIKDNGVPVDASGELYDGTHDGRRRRACARRC